MGMLSRDDVDRAWRRLAGRVWQTPVVRCEELDAPVFAPPSPWTGRAPPCPPEPAPRVVIADDQELVRTGFRLILTVRGIDVVGEASDGAEAVAAVRELRPDVGLLDIRMPQMDGLEAARRIIAQSPDCRVIMLTTFDLDHYVYAALAAGASGSC